MLRAAARRIAIISVALLGGTVVISALIGLAAGAGLERSISVGLYVLGALLLLGCFLFGVRGPLRGVSATGETVPVVGARGVRKASGDERTEATRVALLLFVLGLAVVFLASLIDPAHKNF